MKQERQSEQQKKAISEKLGSDISSSEDELITGNTNKKSYRKDDGNMSPMIGSIKKLNVDDDNNKHSDDNLGNGDNELEDDQVNL